MAAPFFTFNVECRRASEADRPRVLTLLDALAEAKRDALKGLATFLDVARLDRQLLAIPRELAWAETFRNQVKDVGANDLLDKYLAGSAYTAAWYLGLISSVSYTSVTNAADTMASHSGWTEAGATNAPNYSSPAARATAAFSAASGRSKALSSALAFTMSGSGTLKGAFLTTVSTKDGTTGILYSAGLFSGGDRTVASSDVVNVSGSWSLT